MKKENKYYLPGFSATIKLSLRRTLLRLVHYSAIFSQRSQARKRTQRCAWRLCDPDSYRDFAPLREAFSLSYYINVAISKHECTNLDLVSRRLRNMAQQSNAKQRTDRGTFFLYSGKWTIIMYSWTFIKHLI
jgi:hypothetical protein